MNFSASIGAYPFEILWFPVASTRRRTVAALRLHGKPFPAVFVNGENGFVAGLNISSFVPVTKQVHAITGGARELMLPAPGSRSSFSPRVAIFLSLRGSIRILLPL
jgi:hypothetical protein